MTTETTTGSATDIVRAEWDLSQPKTPKDLGSRFDDVVSAETLGRDGVEVTLTLPGGDVVEGSFGLAIGDTGRDDTISVVKLATTQLHDGAWEERIDAFVERFGGDRQEIADYLASALPAMERGEVDPGHYFPGDPRPGYTPTLQLRPDENGVVVNWQFNINAIPS